MLNRRAFSLTSLGGDQRNCSATEYNRTSHRAQSLATVSRVSGAPDSLQDHARRSPVHLRHSTGRLRRRHLGKQPALPHRRRHDGDPVDQRPGQPLVPRRIGTRFPGAGSHPRRTQRAGTPLRAQSQVVPALLFHPRRGHSRAGKPHHEIGRLLSPDRRRCHARRRRRRPLSTARRIPPERLRLLHLLPLRLPRKDRARHPHPRNGNLPRRRSAARV